MKVLINTLLALTICTISVSANAGHHSNSVIYTKAKVVEAVPIYKRVTVKRPVEDCRRHSSSRHYDDHHEDVLPTVVGATVGGVIGHKIFKKSKLKHVGTLAGVVVGAAVGNDIGTRHHRKSRRGHHSNSHNNYQTSCGYETEVVEKLKGYRVTYRYHGELFTTRTKHHPGRRINIKVNVEAA